MDTTNAATPPAAQINLFELHQEISAQARAAEIKAAELRGQLALIERLIQTVQPQEAPQQPA